MVGEEGDGALAFVGFKVNHDFPACPCGFRGVVVERGGDFVVGQHDACDEARSRVDTCGDEIDAAVLRGQGRVRVCGLIAHRR